MLLLKPVEVDPAKPYFAWERRRQLGNSVLYLPANDPIVSAFEDLMEQEELTPDWLALRHRLTFLMRQLRGRSSRISDLRIAIYGPASLTALARRAGEHGVTPCRRNRFMRFMPNRSCSLEPRDFSALIGDPEVCGFHISPKGRGNQKPVPGSLYLRNGLLKTEEVGRGTCEAAVAGFNAGTAWDVVVEGGSRRDCRPSTHVEGDGGEQHLACCLGQADVSGDRSGASGISAWQTSSPLPPVAAERSDGCSA